MIGSPRTAAAAGGDQEELLPWSPGSQRISGCDKNAASHDWQALDETAASLGSDSTEHDGSSAETADHVDAVAIPASMLPGFTMMRERCNSQSMFAEKMHTMLILDWDDTIFPTTWVKEDCRMDWRLPVAAQMEPGPRMSLVLRLLDTLAERAAALLSDAAAMANILIITLAKRPWVELSMNNFMPRLKRVMDTHQFKVIYAQELLDKESVPEGAADGSQTVEEVNDVWTRVKRDVISRELHLLHQEHNVSWKNIISFGDSDFERHGTIMAGEDYLRRETEGGELQSLGVTAEGVSADGSLKRLRTKTVKLLEHPTVEELTAELTVLRRWLPYMVRQDSGFDLELNTAEDNARLREWDVLFTGEDSGLSWQQLAGMPPFQP